MNENIIAGIDLGTTKVCALIAERTEQGPNIIGYGLVHSDGIARGQVNNISKTADAIVQAVSIAENMAGVKIRDLNVGISGEHIKNERRKNYVMISNPQREISSEDLERLRSDVETIRIDAGYEILHIIPEKFFIDYQEGIENPIGMCGNRLEALNNIITASSSAIENIRRSVERAGYGIKNLILQPLASSLSVLEESEKDLGILLIDVGGGTTDIAVFSDRSLKYTKVIGLAGERVTKDIKESLGIMLSEAERLKREYGYATEEAIIRDDDVNYKKAGTGGIKKIPIELLTQIISLRMKELFKLIDGDLRSSGLKDSIRAGVVLTGGGALLKGIQELAEEVFGLPARIGLPDEMDSRMIREIASPEFAVACGLVKSIPGITKDEEFIPEPAKTEKKPKIKKQKTEKPNIKVPKFNGLKKAAETAYVSLKELLKDL